MDTETIDINDKLEDIKDRYRRRVKSWRITMAIIGLGAIGYGCAPSDYVSTGEKLIGTLIAIVIVFLLGSLFIWLSYRLKLAVNKPKKRKDETA